jgi:hypothetical protein
VSAREKRRRGAAAVRHDGPRRAGLGPLRGAQERSWASGEEAERASKGERRSWAFGLKLRKGKFLFPFLFLIFQMHFQIIFEIIFFLK